MNREEFQRLSTERIEDAKVLLAASHWAGAYYLAGYSLECALKSCVIAFVARRAEIIFEKPGYSQKCWTHNLETLVEQAGLEDERDRARKANTQLGANWSIAKDWKELSRYKMSTQLQAEKLFTAINDKTDGVLQWVENFW